MTGAPRSERRGCPSGCWSSRYSGVIPSDAGTSPRGAGPGRQPAKPATSQRSASPGPRTRDTQVAARVGRSLVSSTRAGPGRWPTNRLLKPVRTPARTWRPRSSSSRSAVTPRFGEYRLLSARAGKTPTAGAGARRVVRERMAAVWAAVRVRHNGGRWQPPDTARRPASEAHDRDFDAYGTVFAARMKAVLDAQRAVAERELGAGYALAGL